MASKALLTAVLLLCAATASRFVAIAGLDPALYGKVLGAFFFSGPRIFVFLLQFGGVIYVLVKLADRRPITLEKFGFTCAGFLVVSVARFFIPIFLVSLLGDTLVIWLFRPFHNKPAAEVATDLASVKRTP